MESIMEAMESEGMEDMDIPIKNHTQYMKDIEVFEISTVNFSDCSLNLFLSNNK
jgi:hypothetical protein